MLTSLLRSLTLLTAGGTALAALAVASYALLFPDGPAWWIAARVGVAMLVILAGALTFRRRRPLAGPLGTDYLLLGTGAGMLMVGLLGLAWTMRVAEVTGDPEYWIMLIELALTGQGLLTLFLTRSSSRREPAAG